VVAKTAEVDEEADKNIDLAAELAAAPIDAAVIEEKEHISEEVIGDLEDLEK